MPAVSTNGITLGAASKIRSPRRIDGPRYIRIGDRTRVAAGAWLGAFDSYAGERFVPELDIGSNVSIGSYACITCVGRLDIGDGCVLSEFVYVSDHIHGCNPEEGPILKQRLVSKGAVSIGANTFVGYRVCILPGVVLGRHCVVGAGSVVTHSYPDFSMIAGVPARLLKRYDPSQHKWMPVSEDGLSGDVVQ